MASSSTSLFEQLSPELEALVTRNKTILEYCRDLREIEQSTTSLKSIMDRFVYAWATASSLVESQIKPQRPRFNKDWIPTGRKINLQKVISRCSKTTRMDRGTMDSTPGPTI